MPCVVSTSRGAIYTRSCRRSRQYHDAGSGVEDHPSDKAGMTCISRDMQSLNSAAPAQQPRERSSGRSGPQPMGRGAPGMGKGALPQLPHSQPSGAWMLFLDARARNSSPAPVPSIRPLFHGNQQRAAASRRGRTRTTCKPAQPSQRFLQRSIAPCAHRNVRPGLWLSSRGGQGSRQTLHAAPSK